MSGTSILKQALPVRVKFNPRKTKHRESLKCFLETGRWGDVLFVAELPHTEVPATVLTRLAEYHLDIKRELKDAA